MEARVQERLVGADRPGGYMPSGASCWAPVDPKPWSGSAAAQQSVPLLSASWRAKMHTKQQRCGSTRHRGTRRRRASTTDFTTEPGTAYLSYTTSTASTIHAARYMPLPYTCCPSSQYILLEVRRFASFCSRLLEVVGNITFRDRIILYHQGYNAQRKLISMCLVSRVLYLCVLSLTALYFAFYLLGNKSYQLRRRDGRSDSVCRHRRPPLVIPVLVLM